jgi:hypothetical protein
MLTCTSRASREQREEWKITVVVWIVAPVVIPIVWLGTNWKSNLWRSTAKATVASSMAN